MFFHSINMYYYRLPTYSHMSLIKYCGWPWCGTVRYLTEATDVKFGQFGSRPVTNSFNSVYVGGEPCLLKDFQISMFYASWLVDEPSQFQRLTHHDCWPSRLSIAQLQQQLVAALDFTGQSLSDHSALLASHYTGHTHTGGYASGAESQVG